MTILLLTTLSIVGPGIKGFLIFVCLMAALIWALGGRH